MPDLRSPAWIAAFAVLTACSTEPAGREYDPPIYHFPSSRRLLTPPPPADQPAEPGRVERAPARPKGPQFE